MKNEQFIELLKELKREGVSYKEIADDCNIPVRKIYYCMSYNGFPYALRKQMEYILMDKYREIIELWVV